MPRSVKVVLGVGSSAVRLDNIGSSGEIRNVLIASVGFGVAGRWGRPPVVDSAVWSTTVK